MLSFDNDKTSTSAQDNITCHYLNKYEKWYWTLVYAFEKRDYLPAKYEKHHPVPKEIWPKGWNHKETETVICVSHREHFILHLLLYKMGFSISSFSRFVLGFSRGKQTQENCSGLSKFWKEVYRSRVIPHNKGNRTHPYWDEADYLYWVWKNVLSDNNSKGRGYPGKGYRNLAKATGTDPNKVLRTMVDEFEKGWIP